MNPARLIDQLDAVIFDMDGVLIDSMPSHASAWVAVLAEDGIAISREEVYAREGEPGALSLVSILRSRGLEPDPERIRRLLDRKETLFKQTARLEVFAGARELIAELKRRGKRLAIVTGTAAHELSAVLPDDLRRNFDTLVTGDRVRRGKPDPEPYLTALQELRVPADRSLVVENAPLGLTSAKAAGIRCFTVATSVACAQLAAADRCFASLSDLSAYLLQP